MSGWTFGQAVVRLATENPVLARLALVSLELAGLSALVALLIALFRIHTPRLRALLWLVVLAKPVLGLVIGTPLPLLFLERATPPASAATTNVPASADLDRLLAERLALDRASLARQSSKTAVAPHLNPGAPASPLPVATASPVATPAYRPAFPLTWSLSGFWLISVLSFSVWALRDLHRLRALRRSGTTPDPALQSEYDAITRQMGLRKVPELRISDALDSPALGGCLKPVVLLPRWLAEQTEPGQLDWLLRHELMHWKLSDPLALAVRRLAEILFFFHPAVWWAGRKWEEAMELACDRALLQCDDDARRYAEQLYRVLENRANRQRLALRAGLCATRTQIGKRIASLLSNPLRVPARLSAVSLTGLVLVALLGLSAGLGIHDPARAQETGKGSATTLVGAEPKSPDNPLGLALDLRQKMFQVGRDMHTVSIALASYYIDNKKFPDQPLALTTPVTYLTRLPADPFGKRPLAIHTRNSQGQKPSAMIYSVGPDGRDDLGRRMLSTDPNLSGDLVALATPRDTDRHNDDPALNYYLTHKPKEMEQAEQRKEADELAKLSPTQRIARQNQKVRGDLRAMAIALETYRLDYETYPPVARMLTTPIAYISKIPLDPFADPSAPSLTPGYKPDPGPQYLKMLYAPDLKGVRFYSNGPDGIDGQAAVEYDPSNGTISEGDIVRVNELRGLVRSDDPELEKKVIAQRRALQTLTGALDTYAQRHQEFPERLEQLLGDETKMTKLPEDLFAPGHPVLYRRELKKKDTTTVYNVQVTHESQVAILYSVGPDGKDDGGTDLVSGWVSKGAPPKGDIIEEVCYQDKIERQNNRAELTKKLMDALVTIRQKTGRDNAIIHYLQANNIMGDVPEGEELELVNATLADGWTAKSRSLLTTLTRFQGALAEVRAGVALDYGLNYIAYYTEDKVVPNFLAAQVQAKMLCVEGRYLESQGRPAQAQENYLAVLTMGRDYGAPRATLIGGLIGIGIQQIALKQITRLAGSGSLDRPALVRAHSRLRAVAATQGDLAQWMEGERHCFDSLFEVAQKDPEQFKQEIAKEIDDSNLFNLDDVIANLDRIKNERTLIHDWWNRMLAMPYWERQVSGEYTQEAFEKLIEPMHPFSKHFVPNVFEADTRRALVISRLAAARVAVALELYRRDRGAYPSSLQALVPVYFEALPIDPFSGRPAEADIPPAGKTWRLWSIGPDNQNQFGSLTYDPSNGTVSAGDIVVVH